MTREKVNISMQKTELELLDKRAKKLGLTRSAYLRALVLRDITGTDAANKRRRVTDFKDEEE